MNIRKICDGSVNNSSSSRDKLVMTSTEIFESIISKEDEPISSQVNNLFYLYSDFITDFIDKAYKKRIAALFESAHNIWADVADSLNKRYPDQEKYPQNLFEIITVNYSTDNQFKWYFEDYNMDYTTPPLEKLPTLLANFIKACKEGKKEEIFKSRFSSNENRL